MKQLRKRFLALVLSLVLLPLTGLFSSPVAADAFDPCIPFCGGMGGPPYYLNGLVDFGGQNPAGLRVDIYNQSGDLVVSTTNGSVHVNPEPTSCSGPSLEFDVVAPGHMTCLSYNASLTVAGTYRIKVKAGSYGGETTVDTADASPFIVGSWLDADLITLKRTAVRTTPTPVAQPTPPPPPPPAPPTLTVNTVPTQTEATYLAISGTATPGAAVRLEVDGHESSTYRVGEKGTFMLGTTLAAGETHLKVIATKDGVSTTFEATVTQAPKPE